MKTKMYYTKAIFAIVFGLISITSIAGTSLTVEDNGIYYSLWESGNNRHAMVLRHPSGEYEIADIVIPDYITYNGSQYNVTSLASNAFKNCKKLKTVYLCDNIDQIYGQTFCNSSVENIRFPENEWLLVEYLAFEGCNNLDSLVFNSSETEFEIFYPFTPCPIKKIVFNQKAILTHPAIAGGASKSPKQDVSTIIEDDFPEIVWSPISTIVKPRAFSFFGTTKFYLPNKVILRGDYHGGIGLSNLTTLELEATDDATTEQLFKDAFGADQYDGSDYVQIGNSALVDCKKLTTIISRGETPWTVAPNAFASDEAMKAITLYVPETALDTYKSHPVWGKMGAILPIDNGVEDIAADENGGAVEYFDMQGRRLNNPRPGTLVIRRQGSTVQKLRMEN